MPVCTYVTIHHNHLQIQAIEVEEYSIKTAKITAWTITLMNHQYVKTYYMRKDIKEFGTKGYQAAHKEMKLLHNA